MKVVLQPFFEIDICGFIDLCISCVHGVRNVHITDNSLLHTEEKYLF